LEAPRLTGDNYNCRSITALNFVTDAFPHVQWRESMRAAVADGHNRSIAFAIDEDVFF
jgi:hypothetical protein